MKDIVTKILKEEEATRNQLRQAETDAANFVARARVQGAAMIENVVAEIKVAADKKREEARQGFQAEKEKILSEARKQAAELRQRRAQDIPQLARQIFSQIVEIKV